ncbi:GNAT family N-acetyltransferase [Actinoplanes utahensis]|uniref:N-acetyltransferase domain-containing protein n=1 Tax=Actinoplanes utahensis TaxID=1869 RepID=A0A0A6UES1_ACTUT|nr:hypothetical protein MB27_34285 [Actinoplanes utahensis]GIF33948.1 N-acetyltransferase [Actinoplanes utahensis]
MTGVTSITGAGVHRAAAPHIDLVSDILTAAFLHGDLAPWLIPDEIERRRVYRPYFRMLAAHAVEHGRVDVIGEDACALWYDLGDDPDLTIDDYDRRLAEITGPALPRFQQIDEAMHRYHPRGRPHAYLAFLAVLPGRQGTGLGTALLDHRHAELTREDRPAYLEATGPANSALYQRKGYQPLGPFPVAPDGPHLHPMWWTSH